MTEGCCKIVYCGAGGVRVCAGESASTASRKRVMLIFLRDQLLYDIANCAHIEGDIMDEAAQHARHQTQDVAEDGNVDRVTRVLDLAHSQIVELLYPFTKVPTEDEMTMLDVLYDRSSYVVELSVPADFSQTTVEYLSKLIHELLVCRALADWMSITNPAKAQAWAEKAQTAQDGVKRALAMRMGRIRRKLSPW